MTLTNTAGKGCGYYVETWGGDRYSSVAWYLTWGEAEAERKRRFDLGVWAGKPPKVTPAGN